MGESVEKAMVEFQGEEVTLWLCSDCNTICKHCYVSLSGRRNPNEAYALIEKLKSKYRVDLNGAEILMHREFLKCFSLSGEDKLLTNGLAFKDNPQLIDDLKKVGIKKIGISYHFEFHKLISNINENYIVNLISKLSQHFAVTLLCTVSSVNYKSVLEICKACLNLGIKKVHFTNFLRTGCAKNLDEEYCLSQEQIDDFFCLLNKARKNINKGLLYISRCGTFGKNRFAKSDNFCCPAAKGDVLIAPDNLVYPCVFLQDAKHRIGELIDGRVMIDSKVQFEENNCLARELYGK